MELNCLSLNAMKNRIKLRNGNITNMFLMKIIIETGNFISTQNIVQIGQPCCTPLSKMENKTIRLVSRHFFVYKTYGSSIMATSWSKWVTVWIYRYLNFIMFIQGMNGIQWGPKYIYCNVKKIFLLQIRQLILINFVKFMKKYGKNFMSYGYMILYCTHIRINIKSCFGWDLGQILI